MAWNTFTNGTTADADEVNENMGLLFRYLGADTGTDSTTSASYVDKGSVSVGAGLVTSGIMVFYTVGWYGRNSAQGGVDLRIGESGSEVTKYELDYFSTETDASNHSGNYTTLFYYYTPTSGEKTNGFNVKVFLKITTDGTAYFKNLTVLGG